MAIEDCSLRRRFVWALIVLFAGLVASESSSGGAPTRQRVMRVLTNTEPNEVRLPDGCRIVSNVARRVLRISLTRLPDGTYQQPAVTEQGDLSIYTSVRVRYVGPTDDVDARKWCLDFNKSENTQLKLVFERPSDGHFFVSEFRARNVSTGDPYSGSLSGGNNDVTKGWGEILFVGVFGGRTDAYGNRDLNGHASFAGYFRPEATQPPNQATSVQEWFAKAAARASTVQLGQTTYGADVVMNAPPYADSLNIVEYDVTVLSDYIYRLEALVAAAESRPVTVSLNGREITASAFNGTTGSWNQSAAKWMDGGEIRLVAGKNVLRLARRPSFPHLIKIRITPVRP